MIPREEKSKILTDAGPVLHIDVSWPAYSRRWDLALLCIESQPIAVSESPYFSDPTSRRRRRRKLSRRYGIPAAVAPLPEANIWQFSSLWRSRKRSSDFQMAQWRRIWRYSWRARIWSRGQIIVPNLPLTPSTRWLTRTTPRSLVAFQRRYRTASAVSAVLRRNGYSDRAHVVKSPILHCIADSSFVFQHRASLRGSTFNRALWIKRQSAKRVKLPPQIKWLLTRLHNTLKTLPY